MTIPRVSAILLACGILLLVPRANAGSDNTNSAAVAPAPARATNSSAPVAANAASASPVNPRGDSASVTHSAATNSSAGSNSPPPAVDEFEDPSLGATAAASFGSAMTLPGAAATNSAEDSLASATSTNSLANSPTEMGDDYSSPYAQVESMLQLARELRHQKDYTAAAKTLESVLKASAPAELHRQALFERALVAEDNSQLVKAQQIWAQYLHNYPNDVSAPEVLLRQGILYRQMGTHSLAISKFYAVMSTALKLQLGSVESYKKLVVRAQTEIAETYFLDARFAEAADFYNRILLAGEAEDNREQLELKLIRSRSHMTNAEENLVTIGKAQSFLSRFPETTDVAEVRFILASALKNVGRNQDSMRQVLLLLQAEQANVTKDPATWIYWQRRAGNEIANQLYKEGDCLNSLQIYLSLADLDKSPAWQIPIWYQTGLVFEQLRQWQMASDTYNQILNRQKDLNETNSTPMLGSIVDMAKWRQNYIAWQQKAQENTLALHYPPSTNAAIGAAP